MHLLLNFSRLKNFEEMEAEVVTFTEAKIGSKMAVSSNFSKNTGGGEVPMDVDSLVKAVSGNLASLEGKGGKGGGKGGARFEGTCDNCGKKGHRHKDCWTKPTTGGGKGGAPVKALQRSLRAAATIAGSLDTGRKIAGLLEEHHPKEPRRAAPRARMLGRSKMRRNLKEKPMP